MSQTLEIVVNGERQPWHDGGDLAELVDQLGLSNKRIAVEVNREIIPRGHYDGHPLRADDQIEIIQAIGGG